MPSKLVVQSWLWRSVIAGLAGTIVHASFMHLKSQIGLLPSFQPYQSFQAALSHWVGRSNQAEPPSRSAVIAAAEPQLFVADIRAAYAFYMEKLGFAVVFAYGEPPYYGQVKRDRAWLNLRCVGVPVIDPALRDKEELLSATLMVNTAPEIEQLSLEFQAAGAAFAQPLAVKP